MSNEFQVLLQSNEKGNSKSKPHPYETEFAKSLDRFGEWDVA